MRRILTLVSLIVAFAALASPSFAQSPPTALEAQTLGTGQISLHWTEVSGASQYYLYLGTTAGGPYTTRSYSLPGTSNHLTVSGLNDNLTYYFIIETVVSGTPGPPSNEVSARSGAAQLAAPTGLTATASSGQVALTWNSVPGATAYDVLRTPDASGNNDGILVSALAGTSYTDTNVTNGTTYSYQVAAVCGTGTGVESGPAPATPLSPPDLAAEATANQSGTEIDLSWTASMGATSYTLYRGTSSGGEASYQGGLTGTTYTDTDLPTGTTYYYTLVAVAGSSTSAPSGEVSATTGSTLLAAPKLTVHSGDAQATLTWTAVTGALSYDVYRVAGSGTAVFYAQVLSGTTYTDVNLTDGTTYTYRVAAVSGNGQGTLSNSVSVTPLSAPTISAATASSSEIDLSWTAPAGATNYHLDRSTSSSSGPWTEIAEPTGTTYQDTGLSPGTNYWYHLQAVNARGSSGSSNSVLAETDPGSPAKLTAKAGNNQVSLTWSAPAGDVGSYNVYRGTSAGGESGTPIKTGIRTLSTTDATATNGTTYYYEVTAVDLGGEGARSNEASARPPYGVPTVVTAASAAPNPVTGTTTNLSVSAVSQGKGVSLTYTWTASPTGVTFSSNNGTTTGNTVTATFTSAGSYTFTVTVTDPYGSTATSVVTVVVAQTVTRVTVTPGTAGIAEGATQPFGVNVADQFGSAITGAAVTWSVASGTGTVDQTGLFTAPIAVETDTVAAETGGVTGSAAVTVTDVAPTVASAATATPSEVTGTTTLLSVLGASINGESSLTYTWAVTSGPPGVTYTDNGDNGAGSTTAIFAQAGAYTFTVTIADAYGASVTSAVTVVVDQTVTSIAVTPGSVTLSEGATQQFSASASDQFGTVMSPQPSFTWTSSVEGAIQSSGLFTAPDRTGSFAVEAMAGSITGSATVTVVLSVAGAPTSLNATSSLISPHGTGIQAVLTWTAPAGSVSSYNIYRGTRAGGESSTPIATGVTGTTYTDSPLTNGTTYYYEVTAVNAAGESAPSNEALASPPYGPPTVATAAAASPNPVYDTRVLLSVLGASGGGSGSLKYTWSATGPAPVTFSINGSNPARNTGATFTQAGTYIFTVTITDPYGQSVTGSVTVVVDQSPDSITVTPATVSLAVNTSQTFRATVTDQFGIVMTNEPVTWFVASGVGTIDPVSGVFSTGSLPGTAIVAAMDGDAEGDASVTVQDTPPTVATPASAVATAAGTQVDLSVLGASVYGESDLKYVWSASGPSDVSIADNGGNAAKTTVATVFAAGTYDFTVVIDDGFGGSTTSSVNVTVSQVPTFVDVSPSTWGLSFGGTETYTAVVLDQFRTLMSGAGVTWSLASGSVGSINAATGVYTAGTTPGTATVIATSGAATGTAAVTVNDAPPAVATPASATPSSPTGTTAVLSVLGAYAGGESGLTYTWSSTGPATVTYSANGTNAAKTTTATFTAAGSYVFTVTIADAYGGSAASSVDVTVIQTPVTLTISPPAVSVDAGAMQPFIASVCDQFGAVIGNAGVTWTENGSGTISSTGVYTAPSVSETDTVTAACGIASATATVTVTSADGPIVVTAASASPNPVTGTTTVLSVLGSDVLGESSLTYTWAETSGPAAVTYSDIGTGVLDNGTNAAKTVTATFAQAGTYVFTVMLTDTQGLTATSSTSVTVEPLGLPNVPTGLSATAGTNQIVLTWSDNDTSITSYNIYRASTSGEETGNVVASISGSSGTGITYTDRGLASGQSCYYVVTAVNAGGESGFSNEASAIPVDPLPGAPTNLTASPGDGQVILSWAAPEGPTVSYNVYRGTLAGGESNIALQTGVTNLSYIDTTAVDGTAYYYYVTAVNSGGEGAKSNEASTTPTSAAPTVATAAYASPNPVSGKTTALSVLGASPAGESTLIYSWSCTGPGGVNFSNSDTNSAKNTTATFTQAGTYVFTVTILDGNGQVATSTIGVQVNQTATSLAISPFNISISEGGSQQFTAVEQDQFGYALATQPTSISWSVSGTGAIDQTGHFTASNAIALDGVQASIGGQMVTANVTVTSITGQGPTLPTAPTSLTATASNNQVVLTWSDGDPSVSGYNIYRTNWAGQESGPPLVNIGARNGSGGSYTDGNLADSDTYYYTVTAVGSGGESEFSNETSATPFDTPPTITVPAMASPATVTGTTVVLSVTAMSASGSPLFYSWTASGSAPVTFSANNQIGANTTMATFIEAGSYIFTVIIVDADGEQITSQVDVNVVATLTQSSILPCLRAPYLDTSERQVSSNGGSVYIQEISTDQFGMVLGDNPQWTLTSGSGHLFFPTSNTGTVVFVAPNTIAPETDIIQMMDGNITKTVSIGVTRQPLGGPGHWGSLDYGDPQVDLPQYSYTGNATTFAGGVSGMVPWQDDMQTVVGLPQGGYFSSSGSATVTSSWVPNYPNSPSPMSTYFVVKSGIDIYAIGGSEDGASPTVHVSDSFGDPEFDYSGFNPDLPGYDVTLGAECVGNHFVIVDSSSGMASITTSLSDYLGIQSAGTITNNMDPPEVYPFVPGPIFHYLATGIGSVTSGNDFQFDVDIDGAAAGIPLNLQSITLKLQGGANNIMPTKLFPYEPGSEGFATFDLGILPPGIYTYVAEEAASFGNDAPILLDSMPYTLGVGSCTVQSGSLSSNSVYTGDTITGQVSAEMNPQGLDSGGTGLFVTNYYWTQQAYYSADGTTGSFEPYYGDYTVTIPQQEQATTSFIAVFNEPGFYILKFTCTVAVIDNASGGRGATFDQTCYVGNQSDIDPASQPNDGKIKLSSQRRAQRHTMSGSVSGDISAAAVEDMYQEGVKQPIATYPAMQPTPHPTQVMVGQTIHLHLAGVVGAQVVWSIQGKSIEQFAPTDYPTQPVPLTNEDLNAPYVIFCWYVPGTYVVTATAMDTKGVQTLTATFVVKAPTLNSFTSRTTSHVPPVFVGDGYTGFGLSFGDNSGISQDYLGPGIMCNADVTVPNGGTGQIGILQVADSTDRTITYNDGSTVSYFIQPKDIAIDDGDGLVFQKQVNVPSGGEKTISFIDSPQDILNDGMIKATADDLFTIYLMYQPNNGSWVTIGTLGWGWGGVANRNTAVDDHPNGKWTCDPKNTNSYADATGTQSTELPSYNRRTSTILGRVLNPSILFWAQECRQRNRPN